MSLIHCYLLSLISLLQIVFKKIVQYETEFAHHIEFDKSEDIVVIDIIIIDDD